MTSSAFCPGHITSLFYAPEPGPTPELTGSLGAGVCIALGARARVGRVRSRHTSILPGGGTRLSPGVAMALGEYLTGATEPVSLRLDLELDLPVGQGFGMSGAMVFAALVAAEGELGLAGGDMTSLLAIAHAAEVEMRTGLGDVVAQVRGGIDVRVRQGLPPEGEVLHHREEAELLVAWGRSPLRTSTIISDPAVRQRLEAACAPLLEAVPDRPDLEWLLEAGRAFSRGAGLASEEVVRMTEICSGHGRAGQVMLGTSVFALGELEGMRRELEGEGFHAAVTRVDNQGVRGGL